MMYIPFANLDFPEITSHFLQEFLKKLHPKIHSPKGSASNHHQKLQLFGLLLAAKLAQSPTRTSFVS